MMTRTVTILLLVIVAALLVFEFTGSSAGAQATGSMGQVLQNQKAILEKLDAIEKKVNVIKIRLR